MYRQQTAALLKGTPLVFSIPLQGEDYWHDYERLFPTSKRYEFEPAPRDPFGPTQ